MVGIEEKQNEYYSREYWNGNWSLPITLMDCDDPLKFPALFVSKSRFSLSLFNTIFFNRNILVLSNTDMQSKM